MIKKYVIIILVFYLNSISVLYAEKNNKKYAEKNNKNKIDFDWFNSEEYKMIKKMQNCKVEYLDGSFGTCNPYNSYRNPNLR
jgi:hypothetical protein